jgi:Flp pilus assembly protein TadD
LKAEIAYRRIDDATAEALYLEVLAEMPGFPEAHYGLSLIKLEQGDLEAAVRHAQFADSARPFQGRYLSQLGLCHLRLKNFAMAETALRTALGHSPNDKTCWNNLGIVLVAKSEPSEARQCFFKAVALDAQFENAKQNLALLDAEDLSTQSKLRHSGVSMSSGSEQAWEREWRDVLHQHKEGLFDEAAMAAENLLVKWPDEPRLAVFVAQLSSSQGDIGGAINLLEAALLGSPESVELLIGLGQACNAAQRPAEGEQYLRRAIGVAGDSAEVMVALGESLQAQQRYSEAAAAFQTALDKSEPDSGVILQKLAGALVMACDYTAALEVHQRLIAIYGEENHPAAASLSLCLSFQGQFDKAGKIIDRLLESSPNDPGLRMQRSQKHLLHEEYSQGWEDYRFRGLSNTKHFRVLPIPEWKGEALNGRAIVVLAEQGLGDQIMFASCLPDLLALKPKKVFVEAMYRVAPTLARSFPDCEVISTKQNRELDWLTELSGADCYVPLADLPRYFRQTRHSFPANSYLKADPARTEYWRTELARVGAAPYIGITWKGGTPLTRAPVRSLDLPKLAPLLNNMSATWINLQYGRVDEEIDAARNQNLAISHWPEAIADLDEFSALICALDGVVTACNTTVHYAGALGKPVCVLAPKIPEWRYGLFYRMMPWYPDVSVLRQAASGDWSSVIDGAGDWMRAKFVNPSGP